jgi:serine phosphatase RsbU (regulator of sigma subunit)
MHKFNYPYQLAQDLYGGDDPKQAICSSLVVQPGDLLILASDGMVDNIFSFELLNIA